MVASQIENRKSPQLACRQPFTIPTMRTTEQSAERLATSRANPEAIGRGYRAPTLHARLTKEAERKAAWQGLCVDLHRKPGFLYELQRGEPRSSLPCARFHDALVDFCQTPGATEERLVAFLADLYKIYAPLIRAESDDVSFLTVAKEKGEAADAVAVARMDPTPANCEWAAKELREDAIASTAHAKRLQSGSAV